jgi:hypothetical protein
MSSVFGARRPEQNLKRVYSQLQTNNYELLSKTEGWPSGLRRRS